MEYKIIGSSGVRGAVYRHWIIFFLSGSRVGVMEWVPFFSYFEAHADFFPPSKERWEKGYVQIISILAENFLSFILFPYPDSTHSAH